MYSSDLDVSDIQYLFDDTPPILQYTFDETAEALSYADSSGNGYTGIPILIPCAHVIIDSVTVQAIDDGGTDDFYVAIDDQFVWAAYGVGAGHHEDPQIDTVFCDSAEIRARETNSNIFNDDHINLNANNLGTFSNTFVDEVTVDVTWTVTNPFTTASPAAGNDSRIGNKLTFDGTNYLTVTNGADLMGLTNEFTIMAWVKLHEDNPRDRQIFIGTGQSVSDNNGFSFGVDEDELSLDRPGIDDHLSELRRVLGHIGQA